MLINLSVWFWFLFYLQVRLNIKSLAYISFFVILSMSLLFSAGINFLSNSDYNLISFPLHLNQNNILSVCVFLYYNPVKKKQMLTRHREFREEVFQAKETILLEAENQAHSKFGTPCMVCCGSRIKEGIRITSIA